MTKFPDNFPAQAEEHIFFEELGRAVTYWGQAEGQISSIFSRIMGRMPESYKAANIALNTVLSFSFLTLSMELRRFYLARIEPPGGGTT